MGKGQIYLIKHIASGTPYIGQTRTHYRQGDGFKLWGFIGRWKSHINEAEHQYDNESWKLNNAIREFGSNAFEVTLLHEFPLQFLDHFERHFISEYDSFCYGYNLTFGGHKAGFMTDEQRQAMCSTNVAKSDAMRDEFYATKDIESVRINYSTSGGRDVANVYVYENKPDATSTSDKYTQVDFGGVLCEFEESVRRAVEFSLKLVDKEQITICPYLKKFLRCADFTVYDSNKLHSDISQGVYGKMKFKRFEGKIVERISISKSNGHGKDVIMLSVKVQSETKPIKVDFGSKVDTADVSIKRALEFASKLTDTFNIKYNPTFTKYVRDNQIAGTP